MNRRLHRARICLTLAVAAFGLTVGAPAAAAKEANGHASCMGIEMAAISPLGTSDEIPWGAPEFVGEVRELAESFGLPQGAIDRLIAQAHAGSHEACDAEG